MDKCLALDFPVLHFSGEAREGYGEDCWCYGYCGNSGMIAVFDGCGGSGAMCHEEYAGHSQAYMASRLCAGATYEWMQNTFPAGDRLPSTLESTLQACLQANAPQQETGGITIRGLRTLPSTMAAAQLRPGRKGTIELCPLWAGDSRVYLLDATGLAQLSVDDSNQPDPMEGLYDDGTLTNLLSADRPVRLNMRRLSLRQPFLVLAATDGCYGYVSTPMELEGMILHTLLESESAAQWESNLQKLIASYAGDDHTMVLASFGYGSFRGLKQALTGRYRLLRERYLEQVWQAPWEDRRLRRTLWADYRVNYMKYIEGGQT